MSSYFLGADLGGTKTHFCVASEDGQVVGFAEAGPGNHQTVGYDGMFLAMKMALDGALQAAGLEMNQLDGAGLGIAGYDWPSEKKLMTEIVDRLGLAAPFDVVNDAVPGLVAGSEEGWGVALVSGTGCNCRGLDKDHRREGRVTGYGILTGEACGATELVFKAMQMVSYEWTRRGEPTALSQAFVEYAGARDLEDLLEGYCAERYLISAPAAPLVFQVAEAGDPIARQVITWGGEELGELAKAIIRQMGFEALNFDVVLSGSMFEGGAMLTEPMRKTIQAYAPGARPVRLTVPPVLGAVLIGMEQGGLKPTPPIRQNLAQSLAQLRTVSSQEI